MFPVVISHGLGGVREFRREWLPLNYSFVRIQSSLTNLVRDNKFLQVFFFFKNKVNEANLNTNKRIILRQPFLHRV